MKAIFIVYNQAYNQEIVELLEACGQRGYTVWEEIGGRGSETGEPHLGNHAWPTQNHAVLTAVDDALVAEIMDRLRTTDRDNPKLGLRDDIPDHLAGTKKLIDRAEKIIREHLGVLHACAQLLLEKEKVHREEFEELFDRIESEPVH